MSHPCVIGVHRCHFHFLYIFWFDVLCECFPAYWVLLMVQMSITPYVSFTDGASRSTRNLSSVAWVIYDPTGELIDLQGICLGCTTNNVIEYSVVIELLTEEINLGIRTLLVNLDSQLVVLQLNSHYSVTNPHILRLYLRIRLLQRHFDFITHRHIPRKMNTLTDTVANIVLDRHLHNL